MSRAAAWPSESHTAPQKRVQSHKDSALVKVAWWIDPDSDWDSSSFGGESVIGRGEDETMDRDSARVYGGKWIWGTPASWSARA